MPWFALRDLKRPNALLPAYKMLRQKGIEIFTPMKTVVATVKGRKTEKKIPFLQDLLFARAEKNDLDPIIRETATLQYRYGQGNNFDHPMVIPEKEMDRFIAAISLFDNPIYYTPQDLPKKLIGEKVRIIMSGPLDGYEGTLLKIRGARKKHLLLQLPGILAAEIEVTPDLIQEVRD